MKTKVLITVLIITAFCKSQIITSQEKEIPYRKGYSYLFSCNYLSKGNVPSDFVFQSPFDYTEGSNEDNWYITDRKSKASNKGDRKIKFIKMSVLKGSINDGQTTICYEYLDDQLTEICEEMTGLIQSTKYVWIHPPRTRSFAILEFNPFPEIRYPLKINTNWKSTLVTNSENYSNPKTLEWKGDLTIVSQYNITKKVKLKTKWGVLDSFKVCAKAKNKLGFSELTSYFSKKYGFIKLEYTNIDSSKLILTLEDVKEISSYN